MFMTMHDKNNNNTKSTANGHEMTKQTLNTVSVHILAQIKSILEQNVSTSKNTCQWYNP